MSLGHPLRLIQMIKETEDFSCTATERTNTSVEKIARHISFDTFFHKNSFFLMLETKPVNHIEHFFTSLKWRVCNYKLSRTRQACVVGSMHRLVLCPAGTLKVCWAERVWNH